MSNLSLKEFVEARTDLIKLWAGSISTYTPTEAQWNVWLQLHKPEVLMSAVLRTIKKYSKCEGQMDGDYLVRYTSAIANSMKPKAQERAQ